MAITYPTTLDSITPPAVTSRQGTAVGGRTHYQYLEDLIAAVQALEAKLGVNASAVTTSLDYRVSTGPTNGKTVALTLGMAMP